MGKIRVLDPAVAQRVSASEVITRPLNVIKELVENSLDAGATNIKIELMNGGKKLIQVTDDGLGMDKEDLLLCLKKQATSKFQRLEDFATLNTYGFRGEALPSMAAVSEMTVESKTSDQEMAWLVDASLPDLLVPGRLSKGTRITLKNLFFNVPARLKFLKSDSYEKTLILDFIQGLSLIHQKKGLEIIHNGDPVFQIQADAGLPSLFESLYGSLNARKFLQLEPQRHPVLGFVVQGFLSLPELMRSDSRDLRIFINQRTVRHPSLARAVALAYESFAPVRQWPLGCLQIQVPPAMLDVNIHPMKTEVRIENEALLEEFLLKSVRRLLQNRPLIQGSLPPAPLRPSMDTLVPLPATAEPSSPLPEKQSQMPLIVKRPEPVQKPAIDLLELAQGFELSIPEPVKKSLPSLKILGQYARTFIVCEGEDGLWLVDQHIAQERALYEPYMNALQRKSSIHQQRLLSPARLRLSLKALGLAEANQEALERLGFALRFESGELLITGVPVLFQGKLEAEEIEQLLSGFETSLASASVEDYFSRVAASMACKGSIKAGQELDHSEMHRLLQDLNQCTDPWHCPHGRPILQRFDKSDILNRFHR